MELLRFHVPFPADPIASEDLTRQICGTQNRCESVTLQDTGGVEVNRIALLSQEGSTIETAVEIVRGVVPDPSSLRMHSETFRLRNHPSRHRKERDDAALLTQEGNSHAFTASMARGRSLHTSIDFESSSADLARSISIRPCHHDLFAA